MKAFTSYSFTLNALGVLCEEFTCLCLSLPKNAYACFFARYVIHGHSELNMYGVLYSYVCMLVSGIMRLEPNFADRFAKRKLDESVFLGNRLQVSYAPRYESLSDTKEKLEVRRKEVLARLNRKFKKLILIAYGISLLVYDFCLVIKLLLLFQLKDLKALLILVVNLPQLLLCCLRPHLL